MIAIPAKGKCSVRLPNGKLCCGESVGKGIGEYRAHVCWRHLRAMIGNGFPVRMRDTGEVVGQIAEVI